MIFKQEIAKNTFTGNWPFKVEKGTIINISDAIFFECHIKSFGRLKKQLYAINGNAIDNRKDYGAKELDNNVRLSTNKLSVTDVIMYGLELNPKFVI